MNVGIALLAALIAAFVLYYIWQFVRNTLPNLTQPEVSQHAQVAARRIAEDQGTGWEPATTYYATFLLDDGTRHEYLVEEGLFARLTEGGCGALRTRGTWLRGFTPQG